METIPTSTRPTEALANAQQLIQMYEACYKEGTASAWFQRARLEVLQLRKYCNEGKQRRLQAEREGNTKQVQHIDQLCDSLSQAMSDLEKHLEAESQAPQEATIKVNVEPHPNSLSKLRTMPLVCPACKRQPSFTLEIAQLEHALICPLCKTSFLIRIGVVKTKRTDRRKYNRQYTVRLANVTGEESLIDFYDAKGVNRNVELGKNDVVIFAYLEGKLITITNVTLQRHWDLRDTPQEVRTGWTLALVILVGVIIIVVFLVVSCIASVNQGVNIRSMTATALKPMVGEMRQPVAYDGLSLRVLDVEEGTTGSNDKKYVFVALEVTGISDGEQADFDDCAASLQDSQGHEYKCYIARKGPVLRSVSGLRPSRVVTGWLTFETPESATGFILNYRPKSANLWIRIDLSK